MCYNVDGFMYPRQHFRRFFMKVKPYEGTRPYTFISYAHTDKDKVLEILGELIDNYSCRVWFDSGLHSGDDWSQMLTSKIEESTAFVVFLSPNSIASRHVISEISIAFAHENIKVIPIWLSKPVKIPSNLTYYLSFTQHAFANATAEPSVAEIVKELDRAIPDSTRDVSKIEDGVLHSCEDNIHDLILPEEVVEIADGVCKNKKYLNTVTFSKKLIKIGKEAFRNCTALTKVYIPKNVKYLGDSAFRDCVNIKELYIENEVELGERAFENCRNLHKLSLPKDLKEIYSGLFNSCKSLTHVKLPESLVAIGDNAFGSCDKLESLDIPLSVARIDDSAFVGCASLKEVVIPEGVYKIGKNVFKDCIGLKSISISANLVKIDTGSLRGCISLENILVNPKNKHYKSFEGVMFNKNKSVLICYPPVKENEVYEIPDSVSEIEDWAFSDCRNLKTVIIPDSVQRIGEGAFFHCENLERIVIPYSVDCIDDTAFRGCTKLKEVYIHSKTIKDLGWGIFYGCSEDLVVYYCSDIVKKYCENQIFKSKFFVPDED